MTVRVPDEITGKLPERIKMLSELSYNLWSLQSQTAREMWRIMDYPLWRDTNHNPVAMLLRITPERLEKLSKDPVFLRQYDAVRKLYEQASDRTHHWFAQNYTECANRTIAYFSAEFGFHQSLPIYSGGLGILAGDHCKEASDLGLPLIAIGFMYPQGYFRQKINPATGHQEAVYEHLDYDSAPFHPVLDSEGQRVKVEVSFNGRTLYLHVWKVEVGRVEVYLMDTNLEANDPWDRELSARLYSGDNEMRLRQEIVLGIGGVRLLRKIGRKPAIYHLNEGHCSFAGLELVRELVDEGLTFEEALSRVKKQLLFTTHTPVPAGHDHFSFELMDRYFSSFWPQLNLGREEFLGLGLWKNRFNMTVLALKMAGLSNAVSELNAAVTREMWKDLYPDLAVDDIPIIGITNGIHVKSWLPGELRKVFEEYIDPAWFENQDDPKTWSLVSRIPDNVLWWTHLTLKRKLVSFIRERARYQRLRGEIESEQAIISGALLDPEALTIGFARRFATYKRADMIFSDIKRIKEILLDPNRPVQIIFAGKAHPADNEGKKLIKTIYNIAKDPSFGGRVAFIEDYDIQVARHLVCGVDVWLNTPRRPKEASGTSGMKTAMAGVPNLSILDGWWVEGYVGNNGWGIGEGKTFPTEEEQDEFDARSLYEVLENEVVPLFYDEDSDGIPRKWVQVMKESIRSVTPYFGTRRMLKDYITKMYVPTIRQLLEQ